MSAINLSFNAHQVAPNVIPEPLPTGIFDVTIIDSKEVLVKNGGGDAFYELTMQVIGGEFNGRKVTERLNVKNKNAQAVEIAYSTLSAICYVTGVMVIQQSSAELHGKPFKVSVAKIQRNDDPTKYSNEIRGYFDTAGYEAGKAPQQAAQGFGGQQVQQTAVQQPAFAQQAQPVQQVQQQPAFAQQAAVQAQPVQQAAVQQAPAFVQPQQAQVQNGPSPAEIAAQAAAAVAGQQVQQQQPVQQAQPIQQQAPANDGVPEWARS